MSRWFWTPWPHVLAAIVVGGGSIVGAVASDGDPRVVSIGSAAVLATAYVMIRGFRR